jgi:predicted phosphodiesterase
MMSAVRRRVIAGRWIAAALLVCVAAGGSPDTRSAARPVPTLRGNSLRLAVVGDAGIETDTIARAVAASKPIDAIILVGDNIYPCGVKSATDRKWRVMDALAALDIPIFAVLGNHDYCGNDDAQVNAPLRNWNMPAHQYAIRGDVADFAMLDTTPYALGVNRDAEDEVRDVFASSKATWRIVVGHHVIASSGWHGMFPRKEAARMRRLLPVLRKEHVDVYLCGHDHHEELLDLAPPLIVVSGAASDPVPMVRLRDQTVWPRTTHFREPIGFALLELTRTSLAIEFRNSRGARVAGPFRYAAKR